MINSMKPFLRKRLPLLILAIVSGQQAMAADPIAVDDTRTTLQNVPVTVNVLANDFDADADSLSVVSVNSPSNASVSVNEDGSILVTPAADMTGQIQFTYVITDNTSQSAPASASVTINVAAFSLRNETSNPNDRSLAAALDDLCPRLQLLPDTAINAGTSALRDRCLALYQLSLSDPAAAAEILNQLAPEEILAQSQVQQQFASRQTRNVQQRLLQLKQGVRGAQVGLFSPSGQALSGGSAGDMAFSPWGLFINGMLENGERDRTDYEASYDFDGNSITGGVDYRFNDRLIGGAAVGFNSNSLDYGQRSGSLDSTSASLLFYGTWYLTEWALDGVLGFGSGEVDSKRRIRYTDVTGDFAANTKGETTADQLMASITASYDWSIRAYTLTPFVSVDWSKNDLDAFEENGGGGWELAFDEQSTDSLLFSVGARGQFARSFSWGIWQPTASLALKSESKGQRDPIVARFAFDTDTTNTFDINADSPDKRYFEMALGSTFVLTEGWSAYVNYERLLGLEHVTSQQLTFGGRMEL